MNKDIVIALINPAMAGIIGVTFLLLWRQVQRSYVAWLGAAFLAIGCGFSLQYLTLMPFAAVKTVSNILFLGGTGLFAFGLLGRYRLRTPVKRLATIAAFGVAGFCFFMFAVPSIDGRIYAVNFAVGAMALTLGHEMWKLPQRQPVDSLLTWMLLGLGASFFPRPLLMVWLDGAAMGDANFHQTAYWLSMVLSASIMIPMLAVVTIGAIVMDVISELRTESRTDQLSSLLNRRGFESELELRVEAGLSGCLILCDIDQFKTINDRFGHACGDLVIRHFARCLSGSVVSGHPVGRVGGEEFAVFLEKADAGVALLFAEGIRIAFSAGPVPGLPPEERFTASFGVAQRFPAEDRDALFRRADRALYRAKDDGRDRVRVAAATDATLKIAAVA